MSRSGSGKTDASFGSTRATSFCVSPPDVTSKRIVSCDWPVPWGTGWTVTEVATPNLVQSRSPDEGSPNAVLTATPAGATTVTFAPLGNVVANAGGTPTATQFDFSNPAGGSLGEKGVSVEIVALESDEQRGRFHPPRIGADGSNIRRLCRNRRERLA